MKLGNRRGKKITNTPKVHPSMKHPYFGKWADRILGGAAAVAIVFGAVYLGWSLVGDNTAAVQTAAGVTTDAEAASPSTSAFLEAGEPPVGGSVPEGGDPVPLPLVASDEKEEEPASTEQPVAEPKVVMVSSTPAEVTPVTPAQVIPARLVVAGVAAEPIEPTVVKIELVKAVAKTDETPKPKQSKPTPPAKAQPVKKQVPPPVPQPVVRVAAEPAVVERPLLEDLSGILIHMTRDAQVRCLVRAGEHNYCDPGDLTVAQAAAMRGLPRVIGSKSNPDAEVLVTADQQLMLNGQCVATRAEVWAAIRTLEVGNRESVINHLQPHTDAACAKLTLVRFFYDYGGEEYECIRFVYITEGVPTSPEVRTAAVEPSAEPLVILPRNPAKVPAQPVPEVATGWEGLVFAPAQTSLKPCACGG